MRDGSSHHKWIYCVCFPHLFSWENLKQGFSVLSIETIATTKYHFWSLMDRRSTFTLHQDSKIWPSTSFFPVFGNWEGTYFNKKVNYKHQHVRLWVCHTNKGTCWLMTWNFRTTPLSWPHCLFDAAIKRILKTNQYHKHGLGVQFRDSFHVMHSR